MAKRKPITKSKKNTNKSPISTVKGYFEIIKDERFKFIAGLFFLFFSAFLILAFFSYLFTWKADQDAVSLSWYKLTTNADIVVDNIAGKTGAKLSNRFIHDWFGLGSFGLVFILIVASFRLMKVKVLPLARTFNYSLFIIIWSSITLSALFDNDYFSLGGTYGYHMKNWLNSTLGSWGTFFILFISLFTFLVIVVDDFLRHLRVGLYKIMKNRSNLGKYLFRIVDLIYRFKRKKPQYDLKALPQSPSATKQTSPKIVKTESPAVIKNEFILLNDGKEISINKEAPPQNLISEQEVTVTPYEDLGFETVFGIKEAEVEVIEYDQQETIAITVEKNQDLEISEDQNVPFSEYDPTLDLSHYKFPPIELLEDHKSQNSEVTNEELINNKNTIVETLKNYKIEIQKIRATIGPTITLYEIVPAPGIRISKIKNLEDDIALSLAALGIRIIAPMPGRGTIGIEVPNQKPEIVSMRSVISSIKFQESKFELPIALGKTISNETYVVDLAKMPHLLVAGATGQGKSVGLNAIITSLLYKKHPSQLKFVLVDPKKVELTLYEKIERHFLAKLPDSDDAIITDNQKVIHTLASLNIEMDNRYTLLKEAGVRNIKEYNTKFTARRLNPAKGHHYLPYIVLIIDEFADLIMTAGKEIEMPIARIAQLARAIGIHLIVATQRPSTNIITGVIKANFPTRLAFKVASMIDSRTILDASGANQLIGRGDMLITQGSDLIRLQCAFIDTPEIDKITEYISTQQGYPSAHILPDYENSEGGADLNGVDLQKRDQLFEEAARLIVMHQQGSTSLIQRKMSIGYNRAGRIMDQLEAAGIVGQAEGSKPRQVFYYDELSLESYLQSLNR